MGVLEGVGRLEQMQQTENLFLLMVTSKITGTLSLNFLEPVWGGGGLLCTEFDQKSINVKFKIPGYWLCHSLVSDHTMHNMCHFLLECAYEIDVMDSFIFPLDFLCE